MSIFVPCRQSPAPLNSYNHPAAPNFRCPPVASDGTHPRVFMPVSLLNELLTQHARHRLRGIRLAKLIEKATSRQFFEPRNDSCPLWVAADAVYARGRQPLDVFH